MKVSRIVISILLLYSFSGCVSTFFGNDKDSGPTYFLSSTPSLELSTSTSVPSMTSTIQVSISTTILETDTPEPTLESKYARPSTATITPRPTFTPQINTPVPLEGLAAISLTNYQQVKLISHFFLENEHLPEVNYFNPEVVFSPDSRFLAFIDESRIVLWNIDSQRIERIFKDKYPRVFLWGARVTFSPKGHLIASTTDEGPIVWSVQTGEIVMRTSAPIKDDSFTDMRYFQDYTDIVFSADGQHLITGSYFAGTSITFWDLQTGKIIRQSFPTGNGIHDLDISPDGKTIYTAVRDGQVNFFDSITGDRIKYPIESICWNSENCSKSIGSVCLDTADEVELTPNGEILAVSCRPRDVEVIDPNCLSISNETLLSDDTRLGMCYSTELFSTKNWKFQGFTNKVFPTLSYISFNSDGGIIAQAAGHPISQVKLWNTMTREELLTVEGFPGEIAQVAFSPNGQLLMIRVVGGEIFLYGVKT